MSRFSTVNRWVVADLFTEIASQISESLPEGDDLGEADGQGLLDQCVWMGEFSALVSYQALFKKILKLLVMIWCCQVLKSSNNWTCFLFFVFLNVWLTYWPFDKDFWVGGHLRDCWVLLSIFEFKMLFSASLIPLVCVQDCCSADLTRRACHAWTGYTLPL